MVIRVISYRMTSFYDLPENLWVFFDIFPDTKKSSLSLMFFEFRQNPRCNLRNWSVIKSKINRIFNVGNIPIMFREYPLYDFRRFYPFEFHLLNARSILTIFIINSV